MEHWRVQEEVFLTQMKRWIELYLKSHDYTSIDSLSMIMLLTMTIKSLAIGIFRIGLLAGPVVATLLSATDHNASFEILFLWIFSYLRGIGYDLISHEYGDEASIFILLFSILKTIPLIDYSAGSKGYYAWVAVLILELLYFILQRTSLRVYIVETWAKAEEPMEDVKKNIKDTPHGLNRMSNRNIAILVITTFVFNAIRSILRFVTYSAPVCQLASSPGTNVNCLTTSGASVVSFNIDFASAYTGLAETALGVIFTLRVPFMVSLEKSVDFWATGGGVYLAYIYLQGISLITLVSTNGQNLGELIDVVVMVSVLFFVILLIDSQVSETAGTGTTVDYPGMINRSVIRGSTDIVKFLMAEPILIVLFLIFNMVVFNGLKSTWYVSNVRFRGAVEEFACPILAFIEGTMKDFYVFTSGDIFQGLVMPFAPIVGNIRTKIAVVGQVAAPIVLEACQGPTTRFIPTMDVVALLVLLFPLFPSAVVILSVFPEAAYYTRKPFFWIVSFLVSFSSLVISQVAADVKTSAWYFVLQLPFTRKYTTTGSIVVFCQVAMCTACILLYIRKIQDETYKKKINTKDGSEEKKKSTKGTGAKRSAITAIPLEIYGLLVSVGSLMLIGSVVLAVYLVFYGGSPFDNIELIKTNHSMFPWLKPTVEDRLIGPEMSMAKIFGKNAMIVLQLGHVVLWVFYHFPSFSHCIVSQSACDILDVPGHNCCVDINIGVMFGGSFESILGYLKDALDFAAGVIVDTIVSKVPGFDIHVVNGWLQEMPNLDLAIEFDLLSLTGPLHFQIPAWVPWFGLVLLLLLVGLKIWSLTNESLKPAATCMSSVVVSFVISLVFFFIRAWTFLASFDETVNITLNSTGYLYLGVAGLLILGAIMLGLENNLPENGQIYTGAKITLIEDGETWDEEDEEEEPRPIVELKKSKVAVIIRSTTTEKQREMDRIIRSDDLFGGRGRVYDDENEYW